MRLLVDEKSIPGFIVGVSEQFADKFNIELIVVRKREENLYMLSSQDFDSEVRNMTSYNSFKELIEDMESDDILITDDLGFALHSFPKIAVVIGSDGLVYTQERLEILTIQEHLNRLQGKIKPKKLLKERDDSKDEQFKKTLFDYLVSVN